MNTIKPYFNATAFELYNNDCRAILPGFKGNIYMIFANPPYFLSNGGLTIESGKIVAVGKGEWVK